MTTFVFEYLHTATDQVRQSEVEDIDIGNAYDRYLKGCPDEPLIKVGVMRGNKSYVHWLKFKEAAE